MIERIGLILIQVLDLAMGICVGFMMGRYYAYKKVNKLLEEIGK